VPDQLQGSVEDNVLTMLCFDEQNAATVALRVEPALFSTRAYQRIAEVAVGYLERYHRPPRAHLRDLLESELHRGEEGRFLAQVLDAMDALALELQSDFVLGQLDRWLASRHIWRHAERALDALHADKLEEAIEEIAAASGTGPVQAVQPRAWLHDTASWLAFLDVDPEADLFSSGVDELDKRGVRPSRGALFLVIGAAGAGKSWWLTEIGKRNLQENRRRILHVTLENDLDEARLRYTQAFLAMARSEAEHETIERPLLRLDSIGRFVELEHNRARPDVLSRTSRKQIERDLRPYQAKGRLLVQWFPTGTLTIGQLSAYLDMLERAEGFKPDLLILDYADLMRTDSRDLRISLSQLFRDLRGLAGSRNIAVVTATQGNRVSSTAKTVTSNMVSEDWSKIGTADVVCTYSQTPDERNLGLARIFVAKARRARDKWLALITQSYETGQFCLDSCYADKAAAAILRRHIGPEEGEEDGEA
jgi:hypothetical protein